MRKVLHEFLGAPEAWWFAVEARFFNLKREFLANRIISNGVRLRRVRAARAGVDATIWPDDCAHLDSIIDTLERRRKRLLTKFKEAQA